MESQLDLLHSTDWDILVVLDACRWDVWNDKYHKGTKIRSVGSSTLDWIKRYIRPTDLSDVVCVTGNAPVGRQADEFYELIDVNESHWDYHNGIPTVSPRIVSEHAKPYLNSDRRLYVHYLQPHGPYPYPALPMTRVRPDAVKLNPEDIDIEDFDVTDIQHVGSRLDDYEWLTVDKLWRAYENNLAWVYDALYPILKVEDKRIVVTSDHGEVLGEDGTTGHPNEDNRWMLREVPWWLPNG